MKDDQPEWKTRDKSFYFGADLSAVNMVEDKGGIHRVNDVDTDPYLIFKQNGCNLVRVRLFHTPENPDGYSQWYEPGANYSGLPDAVKSIQRAKDQNMQVCLDFHYSDTWADPANQEIPLAWQGLDLETLKDSVYNYTLDVLNYLQTLNLTPELVQIGNEIDPGILLPVGEGIAATAELLNSGISAVRDFSDGSEIKPRIMIHYADNADIVSRIQTLSDAGVTNFDLIGISYYDQWAEITFDQLTTTIQEVVDAFPQDVILAETAYQWSNVTRDGNIYTEQIVLNGFPVTAEGQRDYLIDLTQRVIDGGGKGIIYWEPAWVNSSVGFNWEVNSMFDFDGNVLPSVGFMQEEYAF